MDTREYEQSDRNYILLIHRLHKVHNKSSLQNYLYFFLLTPDSPESHPCELYIFNADSESIVARV